MEDEKWIKHYSSKQTILLVGEGDFSFALSLATAFGNATNIVATSIDSPGMLHMRYADAKSNLDLLEAYGCTLVYEVDAHTMSKHPALRNKQFDRIVFNFPHATLLYREHEAVQIELHQKLVRGFFDSAYRLVEKYGEVHITHKTGSPFCNWNIDELGKEAGFDLTEAVQFSKHDYPGYINKKGEGHGFNCDRTFRVGSCYTYMFSLSIATRDWIPDYGWLYHY